MSWYHSHPFVADAPNSYFVTELLGTDLHRLLTSRPLEKQFIQYFLYQILVSSQEPTYTTDLADKSPHSEVSNMYILQESSTVT